MNDPREFLKAEYRARRLRASLWTTTGGIAVALLLRHFAHSLWLLALAVTALALLLIRIFYRPNLDALAVALDERFNAKNRLEAVDLLSNDPSALARAQREETARSLEKTNAGPRTPWFPITTTLLALLIALFLSEFSFPFFSSAAPAAAAPSPTPSAIPTATIRWKSPEAETTGTKLEEVPLVAEAESSSGLKDVTLVLSVNGEKKKSVPVDEAVQKVLLKSGKNRLEPSVYLDELNVEAFDVVSYHLQGQRIYERPLPLTASPIQFIQIRPLREDVKIIKEANGYAAYALLTALKVAQLQALKQNFLLSHAEIAKTDPAWVEENNAVAADQKVLADKTHDAIPFLIEKAAPMEVVDLVTQAEPLMRSAAEKIQATKNEPAVPEQEHALALLIEAQKHFIKAVVLKGKTEGQAKAAPKDPFKDRQKIQLPKREDTAAGKLEKLAEKQSELADKLNQPGVDSAAQAKAEREIQEGIKAVAEELNADVRKELTQANEAAQAAAAQLDAKDPGAAREPATRAAERLHAAIAKMLEEGQKSGSQAMDDAQRQLNNTGEDMQRAAGKNPDATEKAKQRLEETAQQLEKEALHQMEQGSATIAKQLQELAKQLRAVDLAKLPAPGSKPGDGTSPDDKAKGSQPSEGKGSKGKEGSGAEPGATDPQGSQGSEPKQGDGTGSKGEEGKAPGETGSKGKTLSGSETGGTEPGETGPGEGTNGSGGSGGTRSENTPAEKLDALAQKLAEAQARMTSGQELLERSLNDLQRAKANLDPTHGGKNGGQGSDPKDREALRKEALDTIKATAQRTQAATNSNILQAGASKAKKRVDEIKSSIAADDQTVTVDLTEPTDALIALIAATLLEQQRDQTIVTGSPEEAPPAYREAVAKYFEQLSRGKAK